jgi:hypothetical protein
VYVTDRRCHFARVPCCPTSKLFPIPLNACGPHHTIRHFGADVLGFSGKRGIQEIYIAKCKKNCAGPATETRNQKPETKIKNPKLTSYFIYNLYAKQ